MTDAVLMIAALQQATLAGVVRDSVDLEPIRLRPGLGYVGLERSGWGPPAIR